MANEKAPPALIELYGERLRMQHRFANATVGELRYINSVLYAASNMDLRRAFAYLEGLAEWPDPSVESDDGEEEKQP